jgi:beta-glucosidase
MGRYIGARGACGQGGVMRAICGALALWAGAAWGDEARPWLDAGRGLDERARLLAAALTQDEKLALLHGRMALTGALAGGAVGSVGYVPGVARLGIPALQETDGAVGVTNPYGVRPGDTAVALPSGVAVAASFNPDVAYAVGAVLGREAAARGFNVVLGGGVNLARDPRGGRNFEYAGEDPLLAGLMVGAAVRGAQDQHVIATVKHFVANDQESQRNTLNVAMPWPVLRASDLLAFEIAIEHGKPGAVMCAYNRVNGPYACENPYLLNVVLKQGWGFPGFVMSDWGAVHSVSAISAGLDQESGEQLDSQVFFGGALKDAVQSGGVAQGRVDDAVTRILRAMLAAGLVGEGASTRDAGATRPAGDVESARRAAEQGVVLLRNEGGVLPLGKPARCILVAGGQSDVGVAAGGGSSQVTPVGGYARVFELGSSGQGEIFRQQVFDPGSPLVAIRARVPGAKVLWVDGRYPRQAAAVSSVCEAAVIFVENWSGEANDLPDMSLPEGQDALIEAVAAINKHTVVVLETGGAVLMPWRDRVSAILEAWYPGSGGADAIADVLFGAVNPSGRLPVTFVAGERDLPNLMVNGMYAAAESSVGVSYAEGADVGYRWYATHGKVPLYPFGFGLSYSSFALSNLKAGGGAALKVSFDVKNTGARAGFDTPQVYVRSRAGVAGPRLIGWSKRFLQPGETQHVEVVADGRLLGDFGKILPRWHVEEGDYEVGVGENVGDLGLTATVHMDGADLPP